jgi:hypothetical protein
VATDRPEQLTARLDKLDARLKRLGIESTGYRLGIQFARRPRPDKQWKTKVDKES